MKEQTGRWFAAAGVALLLAVLGIQSAAASPGQADHAPDHPASPPQEPWWAHAVIYEIYCRSFQDSNGDGVGDLRGISQRLQYLQQLGVDAIWLTPFYPSPNLDFGYDVSNYKDVAAQYGTLKDWDDLVAQARRRHIRVLVDLVLNHSSDQHPWFVESRSSRSAAKRDWYIWRDGRPGEPPTNWQSIFGGPSWTWDEQTRQWYYHVFLPQQPDFNWSNPQLRAAMWDIVRFWLQRGASGFRLDATPYLFEDTGYPQDANPAGGAPVWNKPYNSGLPGTHQALRELRTVVDHFPGDPVLLGESATTTIAELAATYGAQRDEIHLPMDFLFANQAGLDTRAFKRQIDEAESQLHGEPPVFFLSSHDRARQWSAFGNGRDNDQIAKLTAALTLTPRGVGLLYYGEEIGMRDSTPGELAAAPLGKDRPRADERDKARTPMQWSSLTEAGFTSGRPWLPVSAQAPSHNVAAELKDPDSILNWYVKLLQLRRIEPALRRGSYVPLESGNPQVLAFGRIAPGNVGGHARRVCMVFNLSDHKQTARISGWPGEPARLSRVLLASPRHPAAADLDSLALDSYGVLIATLQR